MSIIDGIEVAIYQCDSCGGKEMWIFKGIETGGYKVACGKCHKDQRKLIDELHIPYLWAREEVVDATGNKD